MTYNNSVHVPLAEGEAGSISTVKTVDTWTPGDADTRSVTFAMLPTAGTSQINSIDVVYLVDLAGISDVEGDADVDAPVEYFNLQGIRVNADSLVPGIYVRRQGGKASKVLVK